MLTGDRLQFHLGVIAIQTVIHTIVKHDLPDVAQRAFEDLNLLRNMENGASVLDHIDDRAQVSLGVFQLGYDVGMACTKAGLCHIKGLTSPGGWRKTPNTRHEKKGTGRRMSSGEAILCGVRRIFVASACLALIVWTVAPISSHVPTVIQTLQEHAEMVASHGHSHGLEEDLIWAKHGHSHDVVDHDHSQAVLMPARFARSYGKTNAEWRTTAQKDWSPPHFRLERPPRG